MLMPSSELVQLHISHGLSQQVFLLDGFGDKLVMLQFSSLRQSGFILDPASRISPNNPLVSSMAAW